MYRQRPTRLSPLRLATAQRRLLPDFVILGTQRGGSTSLYRYLEQHPWVEPAVRKEVHFFDFNWTRGAAWYRAHFPLAWRRAWAQRIARRPLLTGEGSPYYLVHPHAPRRLASLLPGARLIALLRNPVDRAFSHYQKSARSGAETLSFEDAVAAEPERLAPEIERMRRDESYYSVAHQKQSYVTRGIYADQIAAWREHVPAERLLILCSEDFFRDAAGTLRRVQEFLGLPAQELREYRRYNRARYEPMGDAVRRRLSDFFEPHNRRLEELVGREFGWR
jgi:hypothetical protein